MYKSYLKRCFDITIALVFFILLFPVFLVTTILLLFANHGKPFFLQKRPGLNGELFKVIKFRTMNNKKDAYGNLLKDAERLTPVGKIIRKTSIDEIPQLLNVLKGDMSLVGPRPLLPEYIPYYTEKEMNRHLVRPGITGLAQINGRNNLSWDKRLELDVVYVENCSFLFDLEIIFKTLVKVLRSDDIVVALDPKKNVPLNIQRQDDNLKKTNTK